LKQKIVQDQCHAQLDVRALQGQAGGGGTPGCAAPYPDCGGGWSQSSEALAVRASLVGWL
jgi:hypothetical protein